MIFTKTYSKLTFVLLLLCTTLIIIPASAVDDVGQVNDYSSLIVTPSTYNVKPGEPFTVDVVLIPGEPVSGAQFSLSFMGDNNCVVANIDEGDFFSKHMALTTFGNIAKPDSASHSIIYSAALGPYSISEFGNLATIQMIAGSSTGYLDIGLSDVIVSNSQSWASPYTVESAKVLVDSSPVLSPMEPLQIEAGSSIFLTLDAFDPDYDTLIYSSTSLPEGASFDGSTGLFEWTTSNEQVGEYLVEFTVDDGYLSDQQSVTIFVNSDGPVSGTDIRYSLEDDIPNTDSESGIGSPSNLWDYLRSFMW